MYLKANCVINCKKIFSLLCLLYWNCPVVVLLLLYYYKMSCIRVLPSHSCGGTLQKLDLKLLHSSLQTSADHQSRRHHVSRMTDEKGETWSPSGMSKVRSSSVVDWWADWHTLHLELIARQRRATSERWNWTQWTRRTERTFVSVNSSAATRMWDAHSSVHFPSRIGLSVFTSISKRGVVIICVCQ